MKKVFSIILCLIVIFSVVFPISNGLQAKAVSNYNPSAAAAYALKYWKNYNPNYSNYNSIGGDCCNFVSQCLYAGGLLMDSNWYWYSYSDRSASWAGCVYLKNYLVNTLGCSFIENPSASQVEVGDVMYYNNGSHVAICSEVIDGTPWVCAHNSDCHFQYWTMSYSTYAVIKLGSGTTFVDVGDNFYAYIVKKKSGMFLENHTDGGIKGNVQLTENGNDYYDPKQIWLFTRQDDGSYEIKNAYDDSCIDAESAGKTNETNVITYRANGTEAQRWFITENGLGYNIKVSYCDKYLDVYKDSDDPGANVQLYEKNDSSAQCFDIYKVENYGITFSKPGKPTSPKLSINPEKNDDGKIMIYWTDSPLKDQHFDSRHYNLRIYNNSGEIIYQKDKIKDVSYLVSLSEGCYSAKVLAVNSKFSNWYTESETVSFNIYQNIGTDFYAYIAKNDSGMFLENHTDGSIKGNVQLAENGNDLYDPKQIWCFTRQEDGSYEIKNAHDNSCMDAESAGTANETNVISYPANGTEAQRWFILSNVEGYSFKTAYCDKCLDVYKGSDAPGTNVQIYEKNNTEAQCFSIYKLENYGISYTKPNKPTSPVLTVNKQEQGKVSFNWTISPLQDRNFDARYYDLRIYDEQGEIVKTIYEIKENSYSISLSTGKYSAKVSAVNSKYSNWYTHSNTVTFTVADSCKNGNHLFGHWEKINEKQHQRVCVYNSEHKEIENHLWDSGITTVKSTYTYSGVKTYTCTVCHATKTEIIPKLTVLLGDVDDDKQITASDARLALRRAVGLEKYALGSDKFLACDITKDNQVTAGDARIILRIAVKLEKIEKYL